MQHETGAAKTPNGSLRAHWRGFSRAPPHSTCRSGGWEALRRPPVPHDACRCNSRGRDQRGFVLRPCARSWKVAGFSVHVYTCHARPCHGAASSSPAVNGLADRGGAGGVALRRREGGESRTLPPVSDHLPAAASVRSILPTSCCSKVGSAGAPVMSTISRSPPWSRRFDGRVLLQIRGSEILKWAPCVSR